MYIGNGFWQGQMIDLAQTDKYFNYPTQIDDSKRIVYLYIDNHHY